MAIIKCKMCGGDIELAADKTFGTCEFCGSTMTLPKVDDDQRAAAFNRGNHFRRIGEFDKALAVYERIVREDDTDAEAHWCCALCRFGIEYVEDPATYEYLPTCHRASFDSFLEDVDYLAAVEHSEGITKRQYQKDGAKIAEVQRGILATSQNEEPFDVFICYKESDENGERTRDSLMAQDVYYQLTDQGYRVFFARITLEDVVGKQYEPYIFAALNSAKVMIAIGTKPEYMNAVWVKNEWSRFLAMMKKDRHKILLPCYKDMDPYDMPEQLSVLQSYDMSKIGFIQDLIRGIKKVIDAEKKPEQAKETVVVQQTAATPTAPLLQRAFMFLEDGEWNSANEYCEKVLDLEPQNAMAYVGKLMVDLKVRTQQNLATCAEPFDKNNNYLKARRFADDVLNATLDNALTTIRNRILEQKYLAAHTLMEKAQSHWDYSKIVEAFSVLGSYKDSQALAEKARAIYSEGEYQKAVSMIEKATTEKQLQTVINILRGIGVYKDSLALIARCEDTIKALFAEEKYKTAIDKLENAITVQDFLEGIQLLEDVGDYKDAIALKAEHEERWASRQENANKVWAAYCAINDKISAITKEIDKKTAIIERINKEIAQPKMAIAKLEKESLSITTNEEKTKSYRLQIAQLEKELSSLGFLAFTQKRELSAKIASLTSELSQIEKCIGESQRFIRANGSIETLTTSVAAEEEKVKTYHAEIETLTEELAPLRTQIAPILEQLENRQTIAMLAQDEKILPLLIEEVTVVSVIKADNELRKIIKSLEHVYVIPKSIQKKLFAASGLDAGAVYYQATQALENATSMDDIKWARGEFAAIKHYKDSQELLQVCEAMIAKHTYKYAEHKAKQCWQEVIMPKPGVTIENCIIGEFIKNVGDFVKVGDILFTYETEKASFECESTATGKLVQILYEEGDNVPCLNPVCYIDPQ